MNLTRFGQIGSGRRLVAGPVAVIVAGLMISQATGIGAAASAPRLNPDAQAGKQTATYCGGGVSAINVTLPRGFNPLTATDAQLVANDLPTRPDDGAELATWRAYVTSGKIARSTCSFRQGRPASAAPRPAPGRAGPPAASAAAPSPSGGDNASANWDGYVVDGHHYYDAYGTFKVANANTHQPPGSAYSSEWVGIGQGQHANTPLVQGGVEADSLLSVGGHTGHYDLWWEVVPQQRFQKIISLSVRPGDTVFVHAHLASGKAKVTVTDETTRAGGTFSYSGKIGPDSTAEWIYERTEETAGSSVYPPLADATTTFTSAQAYGSGVGKRGVGLLPHFHYNMFTCAKPFVEMAYSGAIAATHTRFTLHWKHFGHTDKPGCAPS